MRRLIKTDGTEQELTEPMTLGKIRELIGADTLDFVTLRHLGEPRQVMAVDDNGYEIEVVKHGAWLEELRPVRVNKPFNAKATELYWKNTMPGTVHRIVGDVVITFDSDFA